MSSRNVVYIYLACALIAGLIFAQSCHAQEPTEAIGDRFVKIVDAISKRVDAIQIETRAANGSIREALRTITEREQILKGSLADSIKEWREAKSEAKAERLAMLAEWNAERKASKAERDSLLGMVGSLRDRLDGLLVWLVTRLLGVLVVVGLLGGLASWLYSKFGKYIPFA